MDIYYLGLSSIRIKGKKTSVVIDPFEKQEGGPTMERVEADATVYTHKHYAKNNEYVTNSRVTITGPGEYEVGGVAINGYQIGDTTVYTIIVDNVSILHLGLLATLPTESQIENLASTDIVCVPVGGGTSLDGKKAQELVAKLEPKLVIPMYYQGKKGLSTLAPVDEFINAIGKEMPEKQSKLSITKEKLPGELQIVLLD